MSAKRPVCVVVGVGPGIGTAVARRFAREGFAIIAVARRAAPLEALCAHIRETGGEAHAVTADAENAAALSDAMTRIAHDHGDVDALVYNAAVIKPGAPLEVGADQLVREFKVNVAGALVCAQRVATSMKQRGRGTILITGGGLALDPWPQMASLAIGKAGVRSLALSLHKDLAPAGVHVATVTVAGLVKPGAGALDPDRIADVYWELHAQPVGKWDAERVVQ